jgi:hypothetical protein
MYVCIHCFRADEDAFTKEDMLEMLDSIGNRVRVCLTPLFGVSSFMRDVVHFDSLLLVQHGV